MLYKFHPQAVVDIEEALEWYQTKSNDLPKRFFQELDRYIQIACLYPEIFPRKHGCRKINLSTFPYLIFYRVQHNYIEIIGVFQCNNNSDSIEENVSIRRKS